MKYKKHRVLRKIARLLKNFLSHRSVYIERAVEPQNIIHLVKKIRPLKTRFDLIRVGGASDGGYLLPDDLADIGVCFSPGVAGTATFEMDLLHSHQIGSHLADFSVDAPPMNFQPVSFTKKFIGTVNNDMFMTLDQWVHDQTDQSITKDLLLQMDIEGWEYPTLLSTSEETLKKFRIIVLELHDIESWGHPHFFRIADAFFAKLLTHFYVVHNHPNNFCGTINLGGFESPRVIEITLLRKDRSEVFGFCSQFPHQLDVPNVEKYADIALPTGWYEFPED